MIDHPMSIASQRMSPSSSRRDPALLKLTNQELATHCLTELDHYLRWEPYAEEYGLELLCRATIQDDQDAWDRVQQCFSGIVLGWLHRHPCRTAACRSESKATYVALLSERFRQATTLNQRVEFNSLATGLQYLRACLNGVILDALRICVRAREIPLQEPGDQGEPHVADSSTNSEVWEILQTMLPDRREKRLAYLLFHCGLKPREIVRFCPQEWSDVHEIYRLRCNIMQRLLSNADHLRWRLSMVLLN